MQTGLREKLQQIAVDMLDCRQEDRLRQMPGFMRIPASHYTDPDHFSRECAGIFRRLPLMLAASCELPRSGDYKALDVAGVPVLIVRQQDGSARAFLNGCTHRGSPVTINGCGHAARFVCPYHGWTFGRDGSLVGIASRGDFGAVDPAAFRLKSLPLYESAGLIWVTLDPDTRLAPETFLAGLDGLLAGFSFENWHFVDRRELKGANWKLAMDAHPDFYHLPVLHRATFGATISNRAQYYFWGAHQRLGLHSENPNFPVPDDHDLMKQAGRPPSEWPVPAMLFGEWIMFPNVSINRFHEGGHGIIISQIFPGAHVGESITVQTYLLENEPDAETREKALKMLDFLEHVVRDEDLVTSVAQQRVLDSGLLDSVVLGRNEGGLQHFHSWIAAVLATGDDKLSTLFAAQNVDDVLAMPPPGIDIPA